MSRISLNDTGEEATRKIKHAVTGGKQTIEEQKKYGGNPDMNACQIMNTVPYMLKIPQAQWLPWAHPDGPAVYAEHLQPVL